MKLKRVPFQVYLGGAVVASICLLAVLSHFLPGLDAFRRMEWMTYDWRAREAAAQNPALATNLGFVFISDESIEALSRGTAGLEVNLYWPRYVHARLLRELAAQSAQAVGFDVLFPDERRHDALPNPDEAGSFISSDHFFAQELRSAGNAVLAADKGVLPLPLFRTNALAVGDISLAPDSDGILRRAFAFRDYHLWHRLIKDAARLEGFDLRQAQVSSNQIRAPFPDGSFKVIPLETGKLDQIAFYQALTGEAPKGRIQRWQEAAPVLRAWDMGIVLAARKLGLDLKTAKIDLPGGEITLAGANGIKRVIPVDQEGRFYIDWSITPTNQHLTRQSIQSLLIQDQDRQKGDTAHLTNRWQDKLVVVGSTATGNDLSDVGATPLEKQTYLTSRFWNVANTIIQDRFVHPVSLGTELGIILALSICGAVVTWHFRALRAALLVAGVAAAYVWLTRHVYLENRLWLPLFFPLAGIGLGHFSILTYCALFEQNERRRIKAVFDRIVSPNVVTELLEAEELSLSARRNITIFFADVRGFTEMSDDIHDKGLAYVRERGWEGKEAESYLDSQTQMLLDTINLYLSMIADIVKKNEGTLDKYIGDCVMAFWGAPTPNLRHALSAVRSAIETQRAIERLNSQRALENERIAQENLKRVAKGQMPLPLLRLLSLGTGVNTGTVVVGLMGSHDHILSYTVFGRDVNLASRLESRSERGRILIGEGTYLEILQDDPTFATNCIQMNPAMFKGFREPVRYYEVLWKQCQEEWERPVIEGNSSAFG